MTATATANATAINDRAFFGPPPAPLMLLLSPLLRRMMHGIH